MMGDGGKKEEERARAERERGAQAAGKAAEFGAVTPAEQASRARGFGLEAELAQQALTPQRAIDLAQPAVQGLVSNLTQHSAQIYLTQVEILLSLAVQLP